MLVCAQQCCAGGGRGCRSPADLQSGAKILWTDKGEARAALGSTQATDRTEAARCQAADSEGACAAALRCNGLSCSIAGQAGNGLGAVRTRNAGGRAGWE